MTKPKKILLSCTTFFRTNFSITEFIENFKTIFYVEKNWQHFFNKIIIINEYSSENVDKYSYHKKLLQEHFPSASFIQKSANEFGQAKSLNMIYDLCEDMDFQVQWEEGWICCTPFLQDAISLFEEKNYTQIGITDDLESFEYIKKSEVNTSISDVKFKELTMDPRFFEQSLTYKKGDSLGKILQQIHKVDFSLWPLYSLQPCINRLSFTKKLAPFNTYPSLWPVRFEYIYGLEWILSGGTKAIFSTARAKRSTNKKSTYQ